MNGDPSTCVAVHNVCELHFIKPQWPGDMTSPWRDGLVGLVVTASTSGAEDPGFRSGLQRDFSGSSHTCDLKIGTPVATLPGTWHCRVSTGTGQPGVNIL